MTRPRLHDRVEVALSAGETRLGTVVGRSCNPGLPAYVDVRLDGSEESLKLRDEHVRVVTPAPLRLATLDGAPLA